MTREHDALRDLMAPVALGAAAPHEIARVEAHAAECAICREELASLRGGADLLATAVPQVDPPPGLKESLMSTVRAEAAERAAAADDAPAPPRAAAPRARRWNVPALLRSRPAVAAVAAAVALLVAWTVSLRSGSDGPGGGEVMTLAVAGTPDAPQITGRVLYVPGEDTAVVRLDNLPPLEPGDAYQLWILDEGVPPQSAGLFEQTGPGEAERLTAGLAGADGLAVTAQPRTSRAEPEGPILATAALQPA